MTPQEKANELVQKFGNLLPCEGTTTGQTPIDCALIVAEEVLDNTLKFDPVKDYWASVRNHLLKM